MCDDNSWNNNVEVNIQQIAVNKVYLLITIIYKMIYPDFNHVIYHMPFAVYN